MSEELDNQISDYLEGRMTDINRQEFERLLSENPKLAKEVQDLKSLEEGLEAVGLEELMADMQGWEHELNDVDQSVFTWKKYLAVAAIVTLILIPSIYFLTGQGPTSDELFLAYYQPYDELITTRGTEADSISILLIDGMAAYNQGAFERCSNLLYGYLEKQPEAHRVALYLAIAQLELNQGDQAETNFIRAQKDPAFRQQAQWYQALSYLKFSEEEKAKVILESIVATNSHYRKDEAARLLKNLY